MTEQTYFIAVDTLEKFMQEVFVSLGVPEDEAKISAEILIASDLRGIESHGIGRLKMYYDRIKNGQHSALTNFEVVRESPATAVVDGHHGVGMVIGHRAMNMAIEKARKFGMGSVAVRNSTHFGIAGYYALMAVKQDMVGLCFTNARPSISPTFGTQPMLGTNPIAFGAPSDEDCPFLFDGATSIVQRGKIEVYERAEKLAKEGWVMDQNGSFLTNPTDILNGLTKDTAALLPLGGAGEDFSGYKGYGLATMVEIFSAAFQGGAFLQALTGLTADGKKTHFNLGHFFMALDINAFGSVEEFKHTTGQIIRDLRHSRKVPGADRIYTAGEKEYENEKKVRRDGVQIIPNLQKDIRVIVKELNLKGYDFPFLG